jgi:hypothetical protein
VTTLHTRPGRPGWLIAALLLAAVGAGDARAQGFAADSAPLGAQAATGPAVVYLHGGGSIRGTLLADNGPNGVTIKSQKSGATFMVPAAQIDSLVRGPLPVGDGPEPGALPATVPARASVPPPAETSSPSVPATGAAVALTLKAVRPAPVATPASKPAAAAAPPAAVVLASSSPVVTPPVKQEPPQPATVPPAPPVDSVKTPVPTMTEGLDPPPAAISATTSSPATQVVLPADTTPAEPDTAAVYSNISFISGTEIYIAAGRQDGLVEGSEVVVIRGDSVVATLRVKFLASHKADCELMQGTADLVLGDKVRFHRHVAPQQIASATPIVPRARRLSGQGLHGRIGSRYLRATTSTEAPGQPVGSNGFNQPSLDARLYGLAIGGTPLGLALDLRARQTTTSSAGNTTVDGHTRAYQAVLFWNAPDAKFRAAAGRQYLTYISSIGLFDGGLMEVNGRHTSFGAFAGFEPDAATLDFSSTVHDYGAYLTMHNAPGGMTATAFTLGAVGSYEGGTQRREWGIVQANVSNRYLSLYLLQEIDYYRPWKLVGPNAESSAFSFTSQFANVSARPKPWLSINATYDKRRNVRLIRDFTNPETNFDDAYREGYGMGFQYAGRQFYLGGDWRRSTGATVLDANSYTATFGANRVAPLSLGFSFRATWYQNQNDSSAVNPGAAQTTGHLYSGHISADPVTLVHLDLNAGIRQEANPVYTQLQKSSWYGLDVDVAMARQWYFSFSALRQQDPANPGTSTLTQLYGGLTYRF